MIQCNFYTNNKWHCIRWRLFQYFADAKIYISKYSEMYFVQTKHLQQQDNQITIKQY